MSNKKLNRRSISSITKKLRKLFKTFYNGSNTPINIICLAFYNSYDSRTDEVVTYRYNFRIIINDELYVYDGWCYDDELDKIALGIYSNWLLSTHKLYEGESTTFYNMYTCLGNICKK